MTKEKTLEPAETEAGYVLDEEGRLVPDYEATLHFFDEGDLVTGHVVRIDRDEVLVDIGYKSEGVIPLKELSIRPDADPNDIVTMGEELEALVLQKEDGEGRLILSKKRAEYEKAWVRIEALNKEGKTVAGRVIEVVKGGLIVDIGLRGFLPASLVDLRRVRDLQEYLGQELECKIIEMDRNRNNVVLSRRAVLESERREQREAILDRLEKGVKISGKISSIVPFGAFVDLDGIDGLIHISELSWDHVDHPSEVVQVGEEVEVLVLEVERERQRVSLGLRQTRSDPWQDAVQSFEPGQIIDGRVTKLVPFGAFVDIGSNVEGLIHISEFSNEHVAQPDDMLSRGDEVKVKIIDIDAERRRVSLSLRQAQPGAEAEAKPKRRTKKAEAEAEAGPEAAAEAAAETAAEVAEAPAKAGKAEAKTKAKAAEAAAEKKPSIMEEEIPDLITGELPSEPAPKEAAPEEPAAEEDAEVEAAAEVKAPTEEIPAEETTEEAPAEDAAVDAPTEEAPAEEEAEKAASGKKAAKK